MTVWDFVIGVLFGIVISCERPVLWVDATQLRIDGLAFFFVIQNSQQKSIRSFHTGETAISSVRRPSSQRAYIREVSKQTTILRLQGTIISLIDVV
jgi:SulP family sulfate permease